jgi:hypothetical protein
MLCATKVVNFVIVSNETNIYSSLNLSTMSKEKSGKLKSDKTTPAKTPKEKKVEKLLKKSNKNNSDKII